MTSIMQMVGTTELPTLESLFPIGLFDANASKGGEDALRAIRVLEKILIECSSEKALFARYALLQTFSRFEDNQNTAGVDELLGEGDYLRSYASAIMPEWYRDALSLLSDEEVESFFKIYFTAHECWGHSEGVAMLVHGMITACLHQEVNVASLDLEGEGREIPEHYWSQLGSNDRYSQIGNDFVLGKQFVARPLTHRINVGPISLYSLGTLQQFGWAEGTNGSLKLRRLIEFAEPFYFKTTVKFILETVGFVLGSANLGKDNLGINDGKTEEALDVLLEAG